MPRLTSISRRDLVRRLRKLGFDGPYTGGRHEFMICGTRRLIIPNPHRKGISVDLLTRILRQAGVSRDKWATTKR
ncbi:MAG: type II toxin-antitoxin system HicA family toxin [Anaerolineales bacterium]|nr:type II toxin-antitoxin system HicA family toxin [Anaerolineales bacterium]